MFFFLYLEETLCSLCKQLPFLGKRRAVVTSRLPNEVVHTPSLGLFRIWLEKAPGQPGPSKELSLLRAGYWTRDLQVLGTVLL